MEKNTYDKSIMRTGSCNNRNKSIDIAKGLLILCVVIGHGTQNQSLSDFMYRFHMPLFLILSGCFLKKVEDVGTYAKMKATRLLTPYLIYMAIDFLFFDHLHNFSRIIHYLYGGRFINGVYWYITSLYIALVAAAILLKKLNKKQLVVIGIVFGGIAIIESNTIGSISLLKRPGIPFDADVSLLVLSYLIVGYILKDKIVDLFQRKSFKLDIMAVGVAAVLILEHLLMETYGIPRQIDMKLVVYTNPISVYIIPVLYGFVIARLSAFIERNCERMSRCLSYVGSITIPIMFLHEPLNRFCLLSNYLLIYLLIGMGIPVLLSITVSKFECCKYFGIPKRKIVVPDIGDKE